MSHSSKASSFSLTHGLLYLLAVFLACSPFQDFASAGAGGAGMMFTFHLEAVADPSSLSPDSTHPEVLDMCNTVRAAGMKVG